MVERVFLGWDRPFLLRVVAWLLERRDELPRWWVVVPTAQSGRRLREALAEAGGALLAPRVVTPGSFLKSHAADAAADWIEQLAWVEVLETVADWSEYEALFPKPPEANGNWAGGLAQEMVALRHTLQENGILLATAARKLADTVEADRWDALARLEDLVERQLRAWGYKSRSRQLSEGLQIPTDLSRIVLAGVTEMPPLVERAWSAWEGPVTALIAAPETEANGFSAIGRPSLAWNERSLPWPNGTIQVVADPRQQATAALKKVAEQATASNELVLGSADSEVGDELARAFSREGWPTFHPAATAMAPGLSQWFKIWGGWLADPTLARLADLLSLPETGILVAGRRAQKAECLAKLRDRWLITRCEDLQRRVAVEKFYRDGEKAAAEELTKAADALEGWRKSMLTQNFCGVMERLLGVLGRSGPATEEAAQALADWIAAAAPVMSQVNREPRFWIELMCKAQPAPIPLPPSGRVLNVQGWLELLHEPGRHLTLCGMNEGKVPARSGGEPWLSEHCRERLGLITDAERAARDAFLYQAMLEARREEGRVDVICGKSGAGGEMMLPSRLLLAAERSELPERVMTLFREIEPPEAGMVWQRDLQWTPPTIEPPQSHNVTTLANYLACPFRYYLKQVVRMQGSDLGRAEWNARDFGNVAHEVLERWGRDTEARDSDQAQAIHGWLSAELDRVVGEWFGKRVPLAIRIQTEALRQRLLWLSRVQAATRAEGWEVIDVERKIQHTFAQTQITAKIDRIDRHRESGRLRVIDYKTGKMDGVDKEHRKKITASVELPPHLPADSPAVYVSEDKGKSASYLWHNLQLPLYAAAMLAEHQTMPTPAYFMLRPTEADVKLSEWSDFEMADLEAALDCAAWVAGKIADKVFWPPAEKLKYDDYAVLAAGRRIDEMFIQPSGNR
jgi:ATP-dependent helicase/nuclease subunit B